jgi:uncharacterized protein YqjF (DUF2071 family)
MRTGTPGVYFFSLDAGSLMAVIGARSFFHLPYYWAQMSIKPRGEHEFSYYSRRLLRASRCGLRRATGGWGRRTSWRRPGRGRSNIS